jgi:hypothetical protein
VNGKRMQPVSKLSRLGGMFVSDAFAGLERAVDGGSTARGGSRGGDNRCNAACE